MTTQATNSGSNGFFGIVESILKPSADFLGNYALPVWTAKKLGLQQTDQLYNPTFNPQYAAPRTDGGIPNTGTPQAQPVLFDNNAFTIDATAIAIGAAAIIGVILVVRAA